VPETLGSRLRRLRDARGCSLSELARRSGIGKGTISELENDRRGARLDTLFALTTALDAPLGALLPDESPPAAAPARGDSVAAVLLTSWPLGDRLVEVYRAALGPSAQDSAPHAAGVEETVTVVRGAVRVGAAGRTRELAEGESHRYPGDLPHRFQALGGLADVVLLMHYPRRDARPDLPREHRQDRRDPATREEGTDRNA
jgi:transcriptional regulator with XRE-family HTH domain